MRDSQQLIHCRSLALWCPAAQVNSAFGTNDAEKVTCKVCLVAMAGHTERLLATRPSPICTTCGGSGVDPNNVRLWCPTCDGKAQRGA